METTLHTDCPAYLRGHQDAGLNPLDQTTAYADPINCYQEGWNAGRVQLEATPVVIAAECRTHHGQGYLLHVVTSLGVIDREVMRAYQFGAWVPGQKFFTVHLTRERAELRSGQDGAVVFEFSR